VVLRRPSLARYDATVAREKSSVGREALAYADALYNLARHLTGNATDADDLLQETFARALGAADGFVPTGTLRAWLFRILRNTFIDGYRRRRHDPARPGMDADATEDAAEMPREDFDSDQLRAVVGTEIEQALQALTEDARAVILLDLEGMTAVEVAEVMGCAVGTVKSRLTRARAALRSRLQEYARKQ